MKCTGLLEEQGIQTCSTEELRDGKSFGQEEAEVISGEAQGSKGGENVTSTINRFIVLEKNF